MVDGVDVGAIAVTNIEITPTMSLHDMRALRRNKSPSDRRVIEALSGLNADPEKQRRCHVYGFLHKRVECAQPLIHGLRTPPVAASTQPQPYVFAHNTNVQTMPCSERSALCG